MKIMIVSDAWHPQVNGVVRTYEYISREILKLGHDVRVVGPGDFPLTVPLPGYAEIKLALFPCRRLVRMIEEYAPDRIHAAVEGPLGWAARKYCLRRGLPFTTSFHTQFPDYVAKRFAWCAPFLYRSVHKAALAYVRRFHAPASAMMVATTSLEQDLRCKGFRVPIRRLTRGASLELFSPGEKILFREMKRPVALYVGRVAIEKNLEDFLRMRWPGSRVVVGDGPSLPAFRARYPEVHFAGTRQGQNLADHYRSADVFVFPSRTDTFGIVIIEALACGIPVAAYNETGPKDIITEPFLGCLGDDLATAAARALTCGGSAEQRARHVREHYTWAITAQQFIAAHDPDEGEGADGADPAG